MVGTTLTGKDGKWNGALAPSSSGASTSASSGTARGRLGGAYPQHLCHDLAICDKPIPAIHYMVAASGGPDIRVAPYATYGTKELSELALKALDGRTCCLLRNHGVIATGAGRTKARWLAVEVETLARQYDLSFRSAVRRSCRMRDQRVIEKFKNYRPRQKPAYRRAAE